MKESATPTLDSQSTSQNATEKSQQETTVLTPEAVNDQPDDSQKEHRESSKTAAGKPEADGTSSTAPDGPAMSLDLPNGAPSMAYHEAQSQNSDTLNATQPTPPQSAGQNQAFQSPESLQNHQILPGLTPAGTVFVSPTGQLFFAPFQPCFTPLAQRTVLPAFGIPQMSHPMAMSDRPTMSPQTEDNSRNSQTIEQPSSNMNPGNIGNHIPLPVGPLKPSAAHQSSEANQIITRSEIERRREELKHERDSRFDDLGVVLSDGTVFKSPIQLPDGRWKCWICDNTYKHAKHVRRHAQNHRKHKSFVCEYCSSSFNRNDTLLRHFYKCRQRHTETRKRQRMDVRSPSPQASDDDISVASQTSDASDDRGKTRRDEGNEIPPPIAPAAS